MKYNITQPLPERFAALDEEIAQSMRPCVKRPISVGAVQIDVEFRVQTLEGDYKQGKPGDYLMCGIDGELYICDRDIFERSYYWL
jgi:hypothetical protein